MEKHSVSSELCNFLYYNEYIRKIKFIIPNGLWSQWDLSCADLAIATEKSSLEKVLFVKFKGKIKASCNFSLINYFLESHLTHCREWQQMIYLMAVYS